MPSLYFDLPLRPLAQVPHERAVGPEALAAHEAEVSGEVYIPSARDCLHSAASSLWRINQCERHMMAKHLLSQAEDSLREAAGKIGVSAPILALADDCRKAGEAIGWPHVAGFYERALSLQKALGEITDQLQAAAE